MLGVRLGPDLENRLARFAKKTRQTKSQCAKQALEYFLDTQTDQEWYDRRTMQGFKQIDAGEGIPESKIRQFLDLHHPVQDHKQTGSHCAYLAQP